jgi:hypothetical protein
MTESVPDSLRPKAGYPELDDVGAVVLRAVDHDLGIFGHDHEGADAYSATVRRQSMECVDGSSGRRKDLH